jgi:FG-GAP-like repeat
MASANPMLASILVWATGAVAVGGAAAPFASPMRLKLPTGFRPTAALTADVNADGAGDFVVAGDAGQLVAFLSDARGGFRMSPPTPCGAHPSSLAAGDLTRDGHLDVVVANHETDYITLLVGDGAGVFAARQLRLHSNPHPHGVAIGDFDGDARLDIVVDSWAENHLTLLLGANEWRGPGTAIDVGRKPYWTITAADVDGDGKSDVVTPNEGRGTVSVLLGDGRAGFAHAPGSPLAGGLVPFAATVADLNGDKRPDIAIANYSGHADNTANDGLTWIRNDGSGISRRSPSASQPVVTRRAWPPPT